jgi:hypothetical protein
MIRSFFEGVPIDFCVAKSRKMSSREFFTRVIIPTWNVLAPKMEKCGIPNFLVNKNLQMEKDNEFV